jgi:hypothetical protein
MKLIAFITLAFIMSSCITAHPTSPNRRIHPEFSDLDDLEMMLLNDHENIFENRRQKRSVSSNFNQPNIRLGMARRNVRMTLGSPTQVEVAGNPVYGNERWIYETSVPTLEGYYTEKKVIYFEGGSVVGWESQ